MRRKNCEGVFENRNGTQGNGSNQKKTKKWGEN